MVYAIWLNIGTCSKWPSGSTHLNPLTKALHWWSYTYEVRAPVVYRVLIEVAYILSPHSILDVRPNVGAAVNERNHLRPQCPLSSLD